MTLFMLCGHTFLSEVVLFGFVRIEMILSLKYVHTYDLNHDLLDCNTNLLIQEFTVYSSIICKIDICNIHTSINFSISFN